MLSSPPLPTSTPSSPPLPSPPLPLISILRVATFHACTIMIYAVVVYAHTHARRAHKFIRILWRQWQYWTQRFFFSGTFTFARRSFLPDLTTYLLLFIIILVHYMRDALHLLFLSYANFHR